jgi:hypothetical protein
MVDIDAAIGYVVARGDAVERARLSCLRTGVTAADEILESVEMGQTTGGGWPARWGGEVASVDATCFRLAELDDLDGLRRPAASRALDWLANRQRIDGSWEEEAALAESAPPWARPGDPEARFYLTANAAFWLAVASADAVAAQSAAAGVSVVGESEEPLPYSAETAPYAQALSRAARAILDALTEDGAWPGFLVSGWLAGAVLHRTEWFYESARIFVILGERVKTMSAADVASMVVALRRAGVSVDDSLVVAGRQRLDETQRPDGAWPSDDAPAFDVQTTLTALRAIR